MLILSVSSLTKINTVSYIWTVGTAEALLIHLRLKPVFIPQDFLNIAWGWNSQNTYSIGSRFSTLLTYTCYAPLSAKRSRTFWKISGIFHSSLQNWVDWDLLFLLFLIWSMISLWRAIISPDLSVNVISTSIRWLVFLLLPLS